MCRWLHSSIRCQWVEHLQAHCFPSLVSTFVLESQRNVSALVHFDTLYKLICCRPLTLICMWCINQCIVYQKRLFNRSFWTRVCRYHRYDLSIKVALHGRCCKMDCQPLKLAWYYFGICACFGQFSIGGLHVGRILPNKFPRGQGNDAIWITLCRVSHGICTVLLCLVLSWMYHEHWIHATD